MRKYLYLLTLLLVQAASVTAQRVDITLKDKSVVSYDVDDIDCMEFYGKTEPGQLSGHWYLGYRVMNTSTTHYDGTEHLTFNGTVLKWEKSTGETIYDLEYTEDMKGFTAVSRTTGNSETYTIISHEPELLVLKRSTITRYFYKSINAAHEATLVSFPSRTEYTDFDKVFKLSPASNTSAKTPLGKHFESYMRTITDEEAAFLADYTAQPSFNLAATNKWVAKSITLYPFSKAKPSDVNQHAIGDCCMCAVFASMAYLFPDFISDHVLKKVSSNKYEVQMFDPSGNPITVCVDNKVLCDNGGGILQMTGKNGVCTWATILEKAVMKYEDVYQCNGIGGIPKEHVTPLFTGQGETHFFNPKQLFNQEMTMVANWSVDNGWVGVGGFNVPDLLCGELTTVTAHAFTIMKTTQPDNYLWSMRNPWGNGGMIDGVLEIPNRREVVQSMDLCLMHPGIALPYLLPDIGGYVVPKFTPKKIDLYVSPYMLKMYGLDSYGPTEEQMLTDDELLEIGTKALPTKE